MVHTIYENLTVTTYPHLYIHNAVRQKGKKIPLWKKNSPIQNNKPINHTTVGQPNTLNTFGAHTDSTPLTAWVLGPGFMAGVVAVFPTASSSEAELSLVPLGKSTSSSAFVSGISEKNKGLQSAFEKRTPVPSYLCKVFQVSWVLFALVLNGKYSFGAGVTRGPALSYSFITWLDGFHEPLCGFVAREDPVQSLLDFYFHF